MSYLRLSKNNRRKTIKKICDALIKKGVKFDSFVGRGVSGITVASMLAYRMNKNLVVVRKDKHNSHSNLMVEGIIHDRHTFIIVDDFIETGSTIDTISLKIEPYGKIKGVVLYNSMSYKKYNQQAIEQKILYQTNMLRKE